MDYIEICKRELHKSTLNFRHGAVLVAPGGKVVASHNRLRTNQKVKSIHAEVSVIQKFMNRFSRQLLRECILIVIRENGKGELRNSAPCEACRKYITKHAIPVVYYSVNEL